MAATVNTESVEKEILVLRAVGDETISYLQKYPLVPYEDSVLMKLYKKAPGVDPVALVHDTDYIMDHEKGVIQYLTEFVEDTRIYIQEYEYETTYYKYLSSLRDTIGDNNFDNLRYTTNVLINYFHKAMLGKVAAIAGSDWSFTMDTDVNRIEESLSDIQMEFIADFAALLIQKAELKTALRRAIIISDRTSRLDTTKHLSVMEKAVERDENNLSFALDQYLTTKGILDGTLVLAIKDSIKARTIIDYEGKLNMTYLALYHSKYVNGVAKKHGEVSRKMFPGYSIDAITNGIHTNTWVSEEMGLIFDKHIPSWKTDPYTMRNALNIPRDDLWRAHQRSKHKLLKFLNKSLL